LQASVEEQEGVVETAKSVVVVEEAELARRRRALAAYVGDEPPEAPSAEVVPIRRRAAVPTEPPPGKTLRGGEVIRSQEEVERLRRIALGIAAEQPGKRAKVSHVHRTMVEQGHVEDTEADRDFVRYLFRKSSRQGDVENQSGGWFLVTAAGVAIGVMNAVAASAIRRKG
jgi:hypothetical protein